VRVFVLRKVKLANGGLHQLYRENDGSDTPLAWYDKSLFVRRPNGMVARTRAKLSISEEVWPVRDEVVASMILVVQHIRLRLTENQDRPGKMRLLLV
jgi:hypothetical protein